MASKLNVQVIVGLVDRLSGPLRGLQGRVKAVGQNMQRTSLAMAGVGAGMAAAFAPAIRAFADVEDAATRMELAAMRAGGRTPQFFADLNDLANELGDRLPGTTADFMRMLEMLQRQGMAVETILSGTGEAAANLAVMLKMTPEAAAEFAAKLQDATSTRAKDMMSLADTIQRTYYVGVDPSSMLGAYSNLAPAMDLIGKRGIESAREMAPLIALLDQAKLSGESAGNALRKVFTRSFVQGKDAPGAMKQSGMSLVDKAGEFKGLDNMLMELQKLKKFSTEERLQIIGDIWGDDSETLQALTTMIDKGTAGYAEMAAKMREQASLQERIDKLLGTLINLWDAASGTFTNLLSEIGNLLEPEIKAITKWFGEVSAAIKVWIKDNPELAKTLAMVAVGIGGLLAVLGTLGVVIGTSMWVLAPLASVFGLVGLAIAAVAVALGALYLNWDAVVAYLTAKWGELVAYLTAKWGELVAYLKTQWDAVVAYLAAQKDALFAVGRDLIDGLWRGIQERWSALKEKVAGIANAITGIFRSETETKSPSRVFAALGSDLMRGLELGIRASERLPMAAMRAAAGALALGASVAAMPATATVAPTIHAPAAAAPAVHMPITITINAPAGMDARGLAALVRQQVEAATQQASRGLAALYDQGDGL